MTNETHENDTAQCGTEPSSSSCCSPSSSTGPAHVGAVLSNDVQNVVADDLADELADLLVGPVLAGSPVYRAYVGEGFAEPPTRDMRGCVLLGGGR